MRNNINRCFCGSEKSFEDCCEPYLKAKKNAPTAEALMRSRYTAFCLANVEYIKRTMISPAADNFEPSETKIWAQSVNWDKLIVVKTADKNENLAYVEFMAFYQSNNDQKIIYENSEFHKINGKWFYHSGEQPKVNRNQACPCGSKKKFKRCCINYL